MNNRWLSILITFLSIAVSLAAAEWCCRLFLPEINDSHVIRIANVLEPHHHPLTFRETPAAPDPAAFRIMFLGDSFTAGACDANETFPYLVQTYFRSGAITGIPPRNVQVFNLGVVSYSPSIYGILVKEYFPQIKPHLVVIAVDDSDPQDDLLYARTMIRDAQGLPVSVRPYLEGVPKFLLPLAYHVKLVRVTCSVLQQRIGKYYTSPEQAESEKLLSFANRYEHYKPEEAAKWENAFAKTGELLLAIQRYVRSQGSQIVLLNYPYAPAVTRSYCLEWRRQFNLGADQIYEPVFHACQRRFAEANAIPYYDFTPFMRALPDLQGMYWEENGHFSGKANDLFAREIVRFLAPLLPADKQ
jgi:hypothetical protein